MLKVLVISILVTLTLSASPYKTCTACAAAKMCWLNTVCGTTTTVFCTNLMLNRAYYYNNYCKYNEKTANPLEQFFWDKTSKSIEVASNTRYFGSAIAFSYKSTKNYPSYTEQKPESIEVFTKRVNFTTQPVPVKPRFHEIKFTFADADFACWTTAFDDAPKTNTTATTKPATKYPAYTKQ